MNKAYKKWDDLEALISERSNTDSLINVYNNSFIDVFFLYNNLGDRKIIIKLTHAVDKELHFSSKGLDVETKLIKEIHSKEKVVIITNKIPKNDDIFKAFSASLFDNLDFAVDFESTYNAISQTIVDYKEYFSGEKKSKLSYDEQQGLFGELLFIKENLLLGKNFIHYWEGVNKNKHDFVFDENSVEIKTTRNTTRLNIHISNEKQLDNKELDRLELYVYRLQNVYVGETILDLSKDIFSMLDDKSKQIFTCKLFQAKVNPDENEYLRFKKLETHKYLVDDKFPKIDSNSLNERVFEIKYYLNLDGMEEI